ncbi:MAG: prolipoprotein diacylglyceryl transferase family protein, partial [Planctomycetota bacterium]
VIAPTFGLGIPFGRIGCFFNGCCFGKIPEHLLPAGTDITDNVIAKNMIGKSVPILDSLTASFPRESGIFSVQVQAGLINPQALQSLPVYLTQFFESVAALLIILIVLLFAKYKKRAGEEFMLILLLYVPARFFIEFLRFDSNPVRILGLTISQVAWFIFFLFGAGLFILRRLMKPSESELLIDKNSKG